MNSKPPKTNAGKPPVAPEGRSSIILPVVVVACLIVGGAIAYKYFQSTPPPPTQTEAPVMKAPVAEAHSTLRPIMPQAAPAEMAPSTAGAVPGTAAPPAPVAPAAPTADSRLLMTNLLSLDLKGPISAEDAAKWKQSLQQLIAQGASSIPAIREYLAQNLNVSYAGVTGADQLGYPSLRNALLNALGQIGGPDGTAAMLQTLQSTTFPSDIATLSNLLDQQAPGQYQNEILASIRSDLALAALGQSGEADVGPLYKLLEAAAAKGTDVSPDLQQYSGKWPYYTTMALGDLPNDQGLPTLTDMAENGSGASQTAAAEALAQLSDKDPKALSALMNMLGTLPDTVLAQLAPYLAGRENQLDPSANPSGTPTQGIHMPNGNQDYSVADFLDSMTQTQLQTALDNVNKVLGALPANDPTAQAAWENQKAQIQAHIK